MMAPRAKGPDVEMAALHQKRLDLATKRHETSAAQGAAENVVAGVADRRQAALLVEARGGTPSETPAEVDRARAIAEATVRDARERAEALGQVEQEIVAEEEAVIDHHPGDYEQKRDAAVKDALSKLGSALDAVSEAVVAGRAARHAGEVVRQSCRRRRLDVPAEMPLADLGGAASEISGLRQVWGRFASPPKTSLSVPEVRESGRRANASSSPPGPEPLLERIG
jgi:hypothetical protein